MSARWVVFVVATAEGAVRLVRVQEVGRAEEPASAWAGQHGLEPGDRMPVGR